MHNSSNHPVASCTVFARPYIGCSMPWSWRMISISTSSIGQAQMCSESDWACVSIFGQCTMLPCPSYATLPHPATPFHRFCGYKKDPHSLSGPSLVSYTSTMPTHCSCSRHTNKCICNASVLSLGTPMCCLLVLETSWCTTAMYRKH
jgi:hypothetical protein